LQGGDRCVKMNAGLQLWARETFKEIAANNDTIVIEFFSRLAAEPGSSLWVTPFILEDNPFM